MARDHLADDGRAPGLRLAERAILSAASAVGRPGLRLSRRRVGPVRALCSDLVALRIPLRRGPPLRFDARVSLPDAAPLLDRARGAPGAAIAAEVRIHGLSEADAAVAGCLPALRAFGARLDGLAALREPGFPEAVLPFLRARLDAAFREPLDPDSLAGGLPDALDAALAGALDDLDGRRRLDAALAGTGYRRYAELFPEARALGRRLVLIVGPTNSGKTHEAMRMAAAAAEAMVLSPLRLLAQEHYDRLDAMGLPAGLVTGEESRTLAGATHVACTVESADLGRTVDLAVVDEAQMLADPARGWAWTQAILGLRARTVVMTGSPEAVPLVRAAAALTGEPLEIRTRERFLPLRPEPNPVSLRSVAPGDAVVAFSRRAAMELREALQERGLSVAMVYGNLSPAVRRAEAARFRSGHADVLVATDAIGLGLNLPIRRVVFSALDKFDGRRQRELTPAEIRQIAGRAGRFGGPAEEGRCAVLAGLDPRRLAAALDAAPETVAAPRLYVRPGLPAIGALAAGTDAPLAPILSRLRAELLSGHDALRVAELDAMVAGAAVADRHPLPLAVRHAYASSPLATGEEGDLRLLDAWAAAHAAGEAPACPEPEARDLAAAEASVRRLMAYAWMARRFPDAYPEAGRAASRRQRAEGAVQEFLADAAWELPLRRVRA